MSSILPGFQQPVAVNLASKVSALSDGSIELCIRSNADINEPLPAYRVLMVSEFGSTLVAHGQAGTGQIVEITDADRGVKRHMLKLPASCFSIYPGTYSLHVFIGEVEIMKKTVTVKPGPLVPLSNLETRELAFELE